MKKLAILSLLVILIAMVAQSKPGICIVNGVEMLEKGKTLEGKEKASFLQGVVCAMPEVLDRAEVKISNLKTISLGETLFVRARLDLKYDKQDQRFDETYVVTYKQEPGIIDGMLAFHEKDMVYCDGKGFMPRDMDYFYYPKAASIDMNGTGFDVKRQYGAGMGQNGGPLFSEEGTVIRHYVFDNDGHIIIAEEPPTFQIKHIKKPNASIPGRSFEETQPSVTEDNEPSMLGMLGAAVITFFTQPVSSQNDKWLTEVNFADEYVMQDGFPPAAKEQMHKAFMRWEQNMMYRDAPLWLNWLKANNNTQLYQDFQTFLSEDEQFAQWVKGQATALKDKKARKWWKNALK